MCCSRRGDFGGGTVQVIPHITNEIKNRFYRNPSAEHTEIAIIEAGGTVGDIEIQPFLEAIRQFQHEKGHENVILIHVTLIPYLRASQEMKTKPTQASVKDLQGMGIWPALSVNACALTAGTGFEGLDEDGRLPETPQHENHNRIGRQIYPAP